MRHSVYIFFKVSVEENRRYSRIAYETTFHVRSNTVDLSNYTQQ